MAIRSYIWGIRLGFIAKSALYPEIGRLAVDSPEHSDYVKVVQHFTEAKDALFRLCKKDFYFLLQDSYFKIYSLVISNHTDKDNRKSYLVFSITCPSDHAIDGDILGALHKLKDLYKLKNEDFSVVRNLFTENQVFQCLEPLSERRIPTRTLENKTIVAFNPSNPLANFINSVSGNEVYFIPQGSNEEMVLAFQGFKQVSFDHLIPNQAPAPQPPAPQPPAPQPPAPQPPAPQPPAPQPGPKPQPPNNTQVDAEEFNRLLNTIAQQIQQAAKQQWNIDITSLEKVLSSVPALESRLNPDEQESLKNWRIFQESQRALTVEKEFHRLYNLIYSASKQDRKAQKDAWLADLKVLKLNVDSLQFAEIQRKINADSRYTDLVIEKTWIPKNYRPLIWKLSLGIALILLVLAGYQVKVSYESEHHEKEISDDDGDGIINKSDDEPKTIWPLNTLTFPLKKYVDTSGKLDQTKVQQEICECWALPNQEERKKVKCQENAEWFIYKDKLYNAKKEGNGVVNFYSEENSPVNDNALKEEHKNRFSDFYPSNPKPNSDRLVTIVYHQKKYRLKQGFTLDSGMKSGGALWRFKNNQWEKAANPDNPTWIRATDQDISFLLKIHATEITSVPPNVVTVTEEQTVKTDHSLSSDQYWKDKNALTTTEDGLNKLKSQACDIRNEYNKGSQGLSDISKVRRSKIYEIIQNVCQ